MLPHSAHRIHPEPGGSSQSRTLLIVFLTVFLDLVGFGIIIPIQPFFAESLGATPAIVTLLGASYSLMQFLFSPFWGRLSDRMGRRPIMLVSILITSLGYLFFGLAHSLAILFLARMLSGFGSANIGTAQAIIADSTTAEKRAKGMGLIGAAFGLGFIFGPAIGGLLSQISIATPMYFAAGLAFLNFVLAMFFLPETLDKKNARAAASTSHASFSWKALRHAARHANVPMLLTLYFIYSAAFSLMEASFGLFVQYAFTEGASDTAKAAARLTATALILVGVTATIVQGGLIGRLVKTFGEWKLARFGLLMITIAMVSIPLVGSTHHFGLFAALMPLMALGTGTLNPSLSSLLSRSVFVDEQGGTLGLAQGLAALGRVGGPAVAGLLFESHPSGPFYASGVLLVCCLALAMRKPKVA
ncbi:MAG: MFS transporter [Deltaproteobacteria bacterium]|nr:MFS transporter [Deltaproteobacteria bacterium]